MLITKVYRELSNLETNTCTLQFDINPLNGEVTLWINSEVYIWKMENNILHTMELEPKSVKSAKGLGVVICLTYHTHLRCKINMKVKPKGNQISYKLQKSK